MTVRSAAVPVRSAAEEQPAGGAGISLAWQCVVFLMVLLAIFSRRPDMFLHPQFYAEDGKYWYAQAYNLGWGHSLLLPIGGYLQTLPRLVAGLTLLLPFRFAPLVMNSAGALLQALPVTVLLSSRCSGWGPLGRRMLMAAMYVALPSAMEVHVVVTDAQWHLAMVLLLLAFAAAPIHWAGRCAELLLFSVGAVSGPFCVLLLPLLVYSWWRRRERWSLVQGAMLAAGSLIQLGYMVFVGRPKTGDLGATPLLFLRMLGGNVFLDALAGPHYFAVHWPSAPLVVAAVLGLLFTGYVCWRANLELKLMAILSYAVLLSALHAPFLATTGTPLWQLLEGVTGGRYWYYPILTFAWVIAWCVTQMHLRWLRVAGWVLLVAMVPGVMTDWRYRAFEDEHFGEYARAFEEARSGTGMRIPIPPDGWWMELTKHGAGKPGG